MPPCPLAWQCSCPPWQPARHKKTRAQQPRAATGRTRSNRSSPGVDAKGLSYLGDSIWTLCVRRHFFTPPKHWKLYQDLVQPYVTAEGQACMYDALLSGAAGAAAEEQELLTTVRALVADWQLRKRFSTVHAADAYRKATAFEALVGHLHLNDPARLVALAEGLLSDSSLRPPQLPIVSSDINTS